MISTIFLHVAEATNLAVAVPANNLSYSNQPKIEFGTELTVFLPSREKLAELRDLIDGYLAAPVTEAA